MAVFLWWNGREARQGTANPSTRVQIPSRPPLLMNKCCHNKTTTAPLDQKENIMIDNDSVRPWGRYEVLQESNLHKVKCIYVNPGSRLSYQRHQKRAEHWFIVSGIATVTLNGESFQRVAGETVEVAIGDLHRIANEGSAELVFIEVQTGSYFGEDDIERIEDDYYR